MLRRMAMIGLVLLLGFTGGYFFVYLQRSFSVEGPPQALVQVWHGDNTIRAVLVALLFLIALTALGLTWLSGLVKGRTGLVPIRRDLVAWLQEQATATHEPAAVLAERAIADYRARLEGASDSMR